MKLISNRTGSTDLPRRPNVGSRAVARTSVFGVALVAMLTLASSSQAATSVGLGTAGDFAVLGGSGVTNSGPTVINGDLGTSPTPSVTGFTGAPQGTVNGVIHQADAEAASVLSMLSEEGAET